MNAIAEQQPRTGLGTLLVVILVILMGGIALNAADSYDLGGWLRRHGWVATQVVERIKEVPVPYTPPEPDLDEVINDLSQLHGVPVLLTRAIARQESGRNRSNDLVRYEPRLEAKYHDRVNTASYGIMQVIPVFAKDICKLKSWSELSGRKYIRENVDCGLAMFRHCLDRFAKLPIVQRVKQAAQCYNGSAAYADQVLVRLAEISLEEMEK